MAIDAAQYSKKFAFDLQKFADKMEQDVGKVRRVMTMDIFAQVTKRTPVDTGRLRSSWTVSDGGPSDYIAPVGSTGDGKVEANFNAPFGASFVTNNLPYAIPIEYGHSRIKRPQGMARVSVAIVEAKMIRALGEVK